MLCEALPTPQVGLSLPFCLKPQCSWELWEPCLGEAICTYNLSLVPEQGGPLGGLAKLMGVDMRAETAYIFVIKKGAGRSRKKENPEAGELVGGGSRSSRESFDLGALSKGWV